ncbi:hemerythrin domain-containing protein [Methylobacterium terricola]|uniref:Hemerythrin domain-containing protein n=1 Tax=Methylobacterium terricola TaxID=2583531 RepID=A0A5C4LF43_9HYPH|nr:hemerythrin domain-containing protein [Methylobacterium terricola]TNC11633.1 hemerythrin domain-containing protein [Methylobacterium terricola]
MDIWRLIDRDHANIAQLIREIPNALNGPGVVRSRERLLADLLDELHAHAVAVDAGLLTMLDRRGEARAMVDDLRREHRQVMAQLDSLARGRHAPASGWLNAFEDMTYGVDRHLHRHGHELLPLARRLLSEDEIRAAGTAFVRARSRVLQSGSRRPQAAAGSGGLALAASLGLAAAGAALLAWRLGQWRGAPKPKLTQTPAPKPSTRGRGEEDGLRRGQPRADLAAAAAPGERRPGEDLRARQERLLDEAVEETFPASDPISPSRITR